MESSYNNLNQGIDHLLDYLSGLELSLNIVTIGGWDKLDAENRRLIEQYKAVIGQGVQKRQFDYNSLIVSLYGYLEQYIESLLKAYIRSLNDIIPRYNNIPETIKKNHINLTLELLGKVDNTRYKEEVTTDDLVANLHSCLSGDDHYKINTDSFALHSANFRSDIIDQSFGRVGIANVCDRAKQVAPFLTYLEKSNPDRDIGTLTRNEVYFYLDDLANRRNEVAHGNPSDILNYELIKEYIIFIRYFCSSLYTILLSEYYSLRAQDGARNLGKPIAVHNNSIVCFSIENIIIEIGDILIARTGNNITPVLGGEIAEMQIDNKTFDRIEVHADRKNVALRVSFKAKDNYEYAILTKTK